MFCGLKWWYLINIPPLSLTGDKNFYPEWGNRGCVIWTLVQRHVVTRIYFPGLFSAYVFILWERRWCKWNPPRGIAWYNLSLGLETRWNGWIQCFIPYTQSTFFFLPFSVAPFLYDFFGCSLELIDGSSLCHILESKVFLTLLTVSPNLVGQVVETQLMRETTTSLLKLVP